MVDNTTIPITNAIDLSAVVLSTISSLVTESIDGFTNGNTTWETITDTKGMPMWAGFVGCLVATIFFGSNLVPVKQFSAGDGVFFQLAFCVPVYVIGLIVDLILNNQRLYPLVLVGGTIVRFIVSFLYTHISTMSVSLFLGALWTTGSIASVFCIKTCGLTVGILIWTTTSLIMGWAGGRFGIFGIKPQIPSTTGKLVMNYISVVLAAVSAVFFLFIKSENRPVRPRVINEDTEQLPPDVIKAVNGDVEPEATIETDFPFLNRLSDPFQKALGSLIAGLSGLFYGLMFIPDQYIRDHPEKFIHNGDRPPNNGLYYVGSQYSGIMMTSFTYFVIYAILKRNRPAINPSVALPAMVSGAMWGIANVGFIVAISALKNAVAYPIVSVLPGIITALWSLFWFREIQGKRNCIFLVCGMIVRCLAALLSGLSA